MEGKPKPPPIIVGVSGIDGFVSEPSKQHNWRFISGLPPFQMFAVERSQRPAHMIAEWMTEFLSGEMQKVGPDEFFNQYCQWHKAKGYWPNETPLGKLIEE